LEHDMTRPVFFTVETATSAELRREARGSHPAAELARRELVRRSEAEARLADICRQVAAERGE
jgi:hypothetical protein